MHWSFCSEVTKKAVAEGRHSLALKFALRALQKLALETADLDQRTLKDIRAAFEQLEQSRSFHFEHRTMRLTANISNPLHASTMHNVSDFLHPFAAVSVRTGRFEKARSLFARALKICPQRGHAARRPRDGVGTNGQVGSGRGYTNARTKKDPGRWPGCERATYLRACSTPSRRPTRHDGFPGRTCCGVCPVGCGRYLECKGGIRGSLE